MIKDEQIKKIEDKELRFFIETPLKSADALRNLLYKDDSFYKNNIFTFIPVEDAKKFFYYGVTIEIAKAITETLLIADMIIGPAPTEHDVTENIIYNSTLDKQYRILRKLTELLILLINFEHKTTSDIEYRIYQSAQNLSIFLSKQKSFKYTYRIKNNNTQSSIDTFNSRIQRDLKETKKIPWFLNKKQYKDLKLPIFTRWMSLYREAIKLSNDEEKVLLGISPEKYSIFSQNVHAIITNNNYKNAENNWNKLKENATYISLLSMHIMHKCYKILKLKDKHGLEKIMGANFEKSEASILMSAFKKQFNIGDIVFVHSNDLAEIIECKTSKLGFTVYKIKYLSTPPLPEYPEDWIEGRRLTFLFTEKGIRKFFEESIKKGLPKTIEETMIEMLNEKDEIVIKLMKDTLIQLHKDGLLIIMLLNSNIIKPIQKINNA